MRAIWVLISTIVLAAFAAGYLALSFRIAPKPEIDLASVLTSRREFVESHAPLAKVDLARLFAPQARSELLDPHSHLPDSARYPYMEISALYRYSSSCQEKDDPKKTSKELAKAWTWHRFLCGKLAELPGRYFEDGPWMHPSGSSFAYLARGSGRPGFSTADWLKQHHGLFHLAELPELPFEGEEVASLAGLDSAGAAALQEGAPLVLAGERVLFKREGYRGESEVLAYDVYSASELKKFLAQSPISVREWHPGMSCVIRQGNACWGYDLERIYNKVRLPTLLLFALSLLLTAIVGRLLARTLRRQRLEEERKQFALRTLTHELRTPVAGLLLSAETLKSQFDSLPPKAQETLLRIIDDSQRLARLTEQSRRYLGSFEGKLVSLKASEIPSLKELLEGLTEERGVRLDPQSPDAAVFHDPYWLSVCVRNLISNALAHGPPPVEVTVHKDGSRIGIGVRDGGSCVFTELEEMADPFRKGEKSEGLGLGLSIVTQVAREMGGRIEFQPKPTEFILWLPERRS